MLRTFQNLRIGHRLAAAFVTTVVLMLVIAAAGKLGLDQVQARLQAINDNYSVKVFHATALADTANQQARSTRNLLLIEDASTLAAERRRVDTTRADATALFEKIDALVVDAAERRALDEVKTWRTAYARELDTYLRLYDEGRSTDAREHLITQVRDRQLDYMKGLADFVAARKQEMVTAGREADRIVETATWAMLAVTVVGAAFAMGAGWLVSRSITRPIGRAVEVARRVAAGDLSSRIEVDRRDETGDLLTSLKAMNDNLVALVGDVRVSSDSIATGSGQIAAGSADLSQRTEEQASNLQQTAASMEQLTATVKASADTATQAIELAGAASQAATDGGQVVGDVVATMQRISEASRRISDIIGVIDGIAFQTNILALNAAVEAARAGEQGRGFAVVAGEVRSLAQRSAQAAREVKTLITDSVDKIDAGTRLADTAGRSMQDIVTQVHRVSAMIGELGAAAREQTQGIDQINGAVSQLDQVTQQNAALVEQSTAASESLREQSQRLVEAVARFRLREDQAQPA